MKTRPSRVAQAPDCLWRSENGLLSRQRTGKLLEPSLLPSLAPNPYGQLENDASHRAGKRVQQVKALAMPA